MGRQAPDVRAANRVVDDRGTGYGMIQPGSHPEFENAAPGHLPHMKGFDLIGRFKRALTIGQSAADSAAQDATAKRVGEAAYFANPASKNKAAVAGKMAGR